ncbi:MAG: hypothetical protein CVV27_09710 [Candidatus Melainabacteria bacterium HGW-Melainabacteria-1]|nr:MAG: hypothetical protein CVV27_09710 [Candidatus Melainabacteria bacterium HGW-Melainabacteria-1]
MENQLIIGIDVGKRWHVAVVEGKRKPFRFSQNAEGFKALEKWVGEIGKGQAPQIGIEPTGKFFRILGDHIVSRGWKVQIIPGLYTKRAKYLLNNSSLKTDAVDAMVIADLVKQGKGWEYRPQAQAFDELRQLSFLYSKLALDRNIQQNRFHTTLDDIFPEVTELLDVRRRTLREVIKRWPTPDDIQSAGLDAVTRFVWEVSRGTEKKADQLYALACKSVGRPSVAAVHELQVACRAMDSLEQDIKEVESLMTAWLSTIEYADALLTVPGLSHLAVGILLGQLGDLRLYASVKQVYKMAGLNLVEYSSGQFQSRPRISRHGKAMIRRLLWPSAVLMTKPTHPLHSWYQQQVASKAKKVVFVSGMRKILRWALAMARSGEPFNISRLSAQALQPC